MTKYLKQFELTVQYEEYINSDIAVLPNVSVTNDDNKVHYNPIPNYLMFTAEEDNSTISLTSKTSPDIKYSLNGGAWTQWDYSAITLNMGDTVRMKGNNSSGFSTSNSKYNQFQMTGKISASGNIMSLLYEDNFEEQLTIPGEYCFYCMFYGCTSLTTAPELPATTLVKLCYYGMFRGCTSLTTAPELPSTTLASNCYSSMFYGCTALTTAPELPATTLTSYCYTSMFYGCTALTTAPELPATTLTDNCYQYMFRDCIALTTSPNLPATALAVQCYENMFQGCTSLITAPELRATTLASYCYFGMFYGCTALTTAPKLPATTLANYCYYSMFERCTSLTTAPKLPATKLANYCYKYMFNGCTALTTAPELPAITLANCCYQYMFGGCTSLTTAPELPATILADWCYVNMFNGCTSLITAPELPATTLTSYCYYSMFFGCTSLTTAPELPATTLTSNCYYDMFYNCTKLNYIMMLATNISANGCLGGWVNGVSSTGIFIKHPDMKSLPTGSSGIPIGWATYNVDSYKEYLTFVALEDGTFTFTQNALQYSLDNGTTWTTLAANTASPTVTARNKIMWKQTGLTPNSSNGIGTFSATGNFNIQGNIMSLLYGDDFQNKTTLSGKNYAFNKLFRGNNKVVSAENLVLPATTLSEYCYSHMFRDCTALTTAPELPGTTLAFGCYASIFFGCTSLTTAPKLPATTLTEQCYRFMFMGCTSLITAPELPATTLAQQCYDNMFYNCISLTIAPELPSTMLANSCYNYMFYGCTSLTTAPKLPATALSDSCYYGMFRDCTSLTTAPELPATTLANYCYSYMFYGCTKLNSITCLATDISATNCTSNWVSGVALSGTFTKAASMTSWTSGANGIPANWIVKDKQEIQRLRMWVDDFPTDKDYDEGSITAKMQLEINNPDSEGANPYIYSGDTITYDGNTYYLWRAEEWCSNDNELTRYFATSTVDFDELYVQSLEDDINNTFTSAIGMFDDNEEIYCAQGLLDDGTDIHYLVKIEKI